MRRLLTDKNVPQASADWLLRAGVDVKSIAEVNAGAADTVVLDLARSEERILVTFDRDFGELIYHDGEAPPLGVVYLRFTPAEPNEPARVLQDLFAHTEIELEGRLTVVSRDQVRPRPLP